MKKLITILFVLVYNGAFAQNAIADLKFEEVEIAFNNQDYETTIKKLDEFDKEFGSVTAKSLYLRIVSQDKYFEDMKISHQEKSYRLLTPLRKNVASYLKAMKSEELDDKYREVYKINQKLEKFPFADGLSVKIDAWNYIPEMETGVRLSELLNKHKIFYKDFKSSFENWNPTSDPSYFVCNNTKNNDYKGLVSLNTDKFGNITKYAFNLYASNDKKIQEDKLTKILDNLKIEFGAVAIESSKNDIYSRDNMEYENIDYTVDSNFSQYIIKLSVGSRRDDGKIEYSLSISKELKKF